MNHLNELIKYSVDTQYCLSMHNFSVTKYYCIEQRQITAWFVVLRTVILFWIIYRIIIFLDNLFDKFLRYCNRFIH